MDMDDVMDEMHRNYGRKSWYAYTEIDFASFKPVHVDGFHAWLRFQEEWRVCRAERKLEWRV